MDNRLMAPNRTKRALTEGRAVLGTMVAEIRQPAIMQLLVNGGFDFAIIDNEHGPFSIETIADLSRTAVALGITLGALIVIPLVVLAGLFVWLKLTEEDDEEALELEQEGA